MHQRDLLLGKQEEHLTVHQLVRVKRAVDPIARRAEQHHPHGSQVEPDLHARRQACLLQTGNRVFLRSHPGVQAEHPAIVVVVAQRQEVAEVIVVVEEHRGEEAVLAEADPEEAEAEEGRNRFSFFWTLNTKKYCNKQTDC